jgi:hypothetical protein
MNDLKALKLERFFAELCDGEPLHRAPRLLWTGPERDHRAVRLVLAPTFAALVVLAAIIWTHPGFAAELARRARAMLFGAMDIRVGEAKPRRWDIVVESGKSSVIDLGSHEVLFLVEEDGTQAVKLSLDVSQKLPDGTRKVIARPKVLTRRGTPASVIIADAATKKPLFQVSLTAFRASDKLEASITEVRPGVRIPK